MKKLIFIGLILAGCSIADKTEPNQIIEQVDSIIVLDTVPTEVDSVPALSVADEDSILKKANELIFSTKNASTKVKEIKAIKKENATLKKELVETKAELEQVKAVLADTTVSEPVKKKKKTFIQKVISTIKKDTVQ
jgi:hypothetical protein